MGYAWIWQSTWSLRRLTKIPVGCIDSTRIERIRNDQTTRITRTIKITRVFFAKIKNLFTDQKINLPVWKHEEKYHEKARILLLSWVDRIINKKFFSPSKKESSRIFDIFLAWQWKGSLTADQEEEYLRWRTWKLTII